MSSLHFCKYPENARYTLSKQPLGTWPCGASLISSMEFPLHFPPNSAGWPQRPRFFSSANAQAFSSKDEEQNKTLRTEILMTDIVATATLFLVHTWIQLLFPGPHDRSQLHSRCPCPHLCALSASWLSPDNSQSTNWCRMKTECKLLWCYRHRAPCWASMNESPKWVLKWIKIWKQNSQLSP